MVDGSEIRRSPADIKTGGNSKIFHFHPEPWGDDPTIFFSNGLKPPSRYGKNPIIYKQFFTVQVMQDF